MYELSFMVECMKRGWKVSVPLGEDCRYDVIVDTPKGLSRVQVKAFNPDRFGSSRFKAAYGSTGLRKRYTHRDCDIVAAYAISLNTWWIIPTKYLTAKNINLSKKYSKFTSAWHLIGYANSRSRKK